MFYVISCYCSHLETNGDQSLSFFEKQDSNRVMFPRVTGLSVNELCKAGLDFKDSADNADTDPAPLHLHSVNTSVNRVSLFYCWNTSQQKLNIGLIINGGLTSCSQRISAFLVNLWQWRTDFKKMKVITEKVITHPQTLHPEIYMSSVFVLTASNQFFCCHIFIVTHLQSQHITFPPTTLEPHIYPYSVHVNI